MNHSPAYIVQQYLIDEGIAIDPSVDADANWAAFVGVLPDGDKVDHDCMGVFDTSPLRDGRVMSGDTLYHYGVQVLLRSSDYNAGYAKADAIQTALEAVSRDNITIDSTTYRLDNINPTTGIVTLGQEEGTKRRTVFSLNFLVTLTEV